MVVLRTLHAELALQRSLSRLVRRRLVRQNADYSREERATTAEGQPLTGDT